MKMVEFEVDGVKYQVSEEACGEDREMDIVVLPDGRTFQVVDWKESAPPKPDKLRQMSHIYVGFPPEQIAELLGGYLAEVIA
jgi:hypothetical protein